MVALPSALLSVLALPLAVGGPSEPALDVGGLKYLSWYECCKGTNQPGTPADGPNNRSDTGGFRGDEPGINLGTSGIPGTIEAVFKKHGVPSLFGLNDGPSGYSASGGRLPGVFSWAPKGWGSQNGKLADNWEAAVENITTEIRPLVDSGAIVGVWFGDELAAAGGLPVRGDGQGGRALPQGARRHWGARQEEQADLLLQRGLLHRHGGPGWWGWWQRHPDPLPTRRLAPGRALPRYVPGIATAASRAAAQFLARFAQVIGRTFRVR